MRPHRLTLRRTALAALLALATAPAAARAQGAYKIEPLKEAPPASLAAPVRESLSGEGFRVFDEQGKPYAEVWLRKAVPGSEKPGGPKGAVQFPFLADGELLGALRFPGQGHDNRDQTIARGVYTLRYSLQPVNGDHLGVSPFRDYALLLSAPRDKALNDVPRKPLEEASAAAAGTSHPAVLMLVAAPSTGPSIARDEEKGTAGAVVPLNVEVKGGDRATVNVQIVLFGVVGG